jgi:Xaa-Pro aminopeptidase
MPTNKKIEEYDIIIIDMGCVYKGYCSDMTRTIFVKGVQEVYKKTYDIVLRNQLLTLKEMKDGRSIKLMTTLVENDYVLNKLELVHALGHGVGLDIHEMPIISSKSKDYLKEDMVVTNEPGIYLPGHFGVRIEDTVQVKKLEGVSLTKSDKNYVIVGN